MYWCIGTTSFRVGNHLVKNKELLNTLIEFWKTSVGSNSYTVYDSAYVTGLSNKMTAVPNVNVKSGPDFAFTYGISAAGAITVSGNFSKYRITYFN